MLPFRGVGALCDAAWFAAIHDVCSVTVAAQIRKAGLISPLLRTLDVRCVREIPTIDGRRAAICCVQGSVSREVYLKIHIIFYLVGTGGPASALPKSRSHLRVHAAANRQKAGSGAAVRDDALSSVSPPASARTAVRPKEAGVGARRLAPLPVCQPQATAKRKSSASSPTTIRIRTSSMSDAVPSKSIVVVVPSSVIRDDRLAKSVKP